MTSPSTVPLFSHFFFYCDTDGLPHAAACDSSPSSSHHVASPSVADPEDQAHCNQRSVVYQTAAGRVSVMAGSVPLGKSQSPGSPGTFLSCFQASGAAPNSRHHPGAPHNAPPALHMLLKGCVKHRLELLKTAKSNTIWTGPEKSHSEILGVGAARTRSWERLVLLCSFCRPRDTILCSLLK